MFVKGIHLYTVQGISKQNDNSANTFNKTRGKIVNCVQ